MLKDVAAIRCSCAGIGKRQSSYDVTDADVCGKQQPKGLVNQRAQKEETFELQPRRGIEVAPSAGGAEPAAVLNVETSSAQGSAGPSQHRPKRIDLQTHAGKFGTRNALYPKQGGNFASRVSRFGRQNVLGAIHIDILDWRCHDHPCQVDDGAVAEVPR